MTDCIFCKISEGEIPAKLVYQDSDLFAFEDIAPQAPTHILICTWKHTPSRSSMPRPKTWRCSGARCCWRRNSRPSVASPAVTAWW